MSHTFGRAKRNRRGGRSLSRSAFFEVGHFGTSDALSPLAEVTAQRLVEGLGRGASDAWRPLALIALPASFRWLSDSSIACRLLSHLAPLPCPLPASGGEGVR